MPTRLWRHLSTASASALAVGLALSLASAPTAQASGTDTPAGQTAQTSQDTAVAATKEHLDAADPLHLVEPPQSPSQAKAAAARLAKARAHVAQPAGSMTPASCPPSDPCPPTHVSWNLAGTQEAQINSYYCGPAAVRGALRMVNVSVAQSTLGSEMGTASNGGTAWYNGRYPVEAAMDKYTAAKGLHYDSVPVSYTATSTDKANFTTRLLTDVDYGAPMIGDAYEVPSGPHLVGHPAGSTIYHWFAIRGYASSGATTSYQDSVHGATSISWSSGVPAYSSLASSTVTSIVGGRGYVW